MQFSDTANLTHRRLAVDTSGTLIVASYDAEHGILTLSGEDSVSHYEQVLSSLQQFLNTVDTGPGTLQISVSDGRHESDWAAAATIYAYESAAAQREADLAGRRAGAGADRSDSVARRSRTGRPCAAADRAAAGRAGFA